MKIVWLADASTDFAQLIADVHAINPAAADALDLRICSAISHLSTFPEAGRLGRVSGTRELVIIDYPYIVIYRALVAEIQILSIRHTSRQWPASIETTFGR